MSYKIFTSSFLITIGSLWSYHFSPESYFHLLHRSPCIILAKCLRLHCMDCFWESLLHAATIWAMVSLLSLESLHSKEISSLSISFCMYLVLRAWSWAIIIILSVSFLNSPWLSHIHMLVSLSVHSVHQNIPCKVIALYFSLFSDIIFLLSLSQYLFSMDFFSSFSSLLHIYSPRLSISISTESSTLISPLPPLLHSKYSLHITLRVNCSADVYHLSGLSVHILKFIFHPFQYSYTISHNLHNSGIQVSPFSCDFKIFCIL